jgi:putative endonuclease
VKARQSQENAARTLPTWQQRRIVRAARYWLSSHPNFAGYAMAFDVEFDALWRWPHHVAGAFRI